MPSCGCEVYCGFFVCFGFGFWFICFVSFRFGFAHLLVSIQSNGLHNLIFTNINTASGCSMSHIHQHSLLWQPWSTRGPVAAQATHTNMALRGITCWCPWSILGLWGLFLICTATENYVGVYDTYCRGLIHGQGSVCHSVIDDSVLIWETSKVSAKTALPKRKKK